jgi:hypothetical protein
MQAKIGKYYAQKVIIELENMGLLTDPEATNREKRQEKKSNIIWTPRRSYSCWLSGLRNQGTPIMTITCSLHFTMALLCQLPLFLIGLKPGLTTRVHFVTQIFSLWNVSSIVECKLKCVLLMGEFHLCFIDEKHLVNTNTVPKKLCRCPVSGRMDFNAISGNFCDKYNMIVDTAAIQGSLLTLFIPLVNILVQLQPLFLYVK